MSSPTQNAAIANAINSARIFSAQVNNTDGSVSNVTDLSNGLNFNADSKTTIILFNASSQTINLNLTCSFVLNSKNSIFAVVQTPINPKDPNNPPTQNIVLNNNNSLNPVTTNASLQSMNMILLTVAPMANAIPDGVLIVTINSGVPSSTPSSPQTSHTFLYILIAIIVLLILGALLYYFSSRKHGSSLLASSSSSLSASSASSSSTV